MFKDPILKRLQKKYPKPNFNNRSEYLFEDLVESIISQQLSIKASATIFSRFKKLFTKEQFPKPSDILSMNSEKIREAGISYQKISYLKSIANAFISNIINIEEIKKA